MERLDRTRGEGAGNPSRGSEIVRFTRERFRILSCFKEIPCRLKQDALFFPFFLPLPTKLCRMYE